MIYLNDYLKKLYLGNRKFSVAQLSKIFVLSEDDIKHRLIKRGVTLRVPDVSLRTNDNKKVVYPPSVKMELRSLRENNKYASSRLREMKRKEEVQLFAKDYERGLTMLEIAKKSGLSVKTVQRRLKDAGVRPRSGPGSSVLSVKGVGVRTRGRGSCVLSIKDQRVVFSNLYRLGLTMEDIAMKYGVSFKTVQRRLKDAGVRVRSHSSRSRNNVFFVSEKNFVYSKVLR